MRHVTTPDPQWIEELEGPEGYTIDLMADWDAQNPREEFDHFAMLVGSGDLLVDTGFDGRLDEVRDYCRFRLGRQGDKVLRRYLSIFRPDIVHFCDYWDGGQRGDYGWGYVTRQGWEAAMGADYSGDVTPADLFEQELNEYRAWASGEVYGVIVINDETGAEASLWGIYDDYPYNYIKQDVVPDLIDEVTPTSEEGN